MANGKIIIGTSHARANVLMQHANISRVHCEIEQRGDKILYVHKSESQVTWIRRTQTGKFNLIRKNADGVEHCVALNNRDALFLGAPPLKHMWDRTPDEPPQGLDHPVILQVWWTREHVQKGKQSSKQKKAKKKEKQKQAKKNDGHALKKCDQKTSDTVISLQQEIDDAKRRGDKEAGCTASSRLFKLVAKQSKEAEWQRRMEEEKAQSQCNQNHRESRRSSLRGRGAQGRGRGRVAGGRGRSRGGPYKGRRGNISGKYYAPFKHNKRYQHAGHTGRR